MNLHSLILQIQLIIFSTILRMSFKFTPMVLLIGLWSCIPLGTTTTPSTNKKLTFDDRNYEEYVGNVILNSNNPFQELGSNRPLILEFDLLSDKFENLQVRYIHCNSDWSKSKLQDIEFLSSFNQFDHSSFVYSTNTKVHYLQYFFELDQPILSGNYLIVVHRRNSVDDILISRRMIFYQNRVEITGNIRASSIVKDRRTHQQIDYELKYDQIEAPNPLRDFKTIILQNKNWNSAIANLDPTSIQLGQKIMKWNLFTGENTFPGWNQFRYLDLRTLNLRGMNIGKIEKKDHIWSVFQGLDKSFEGSSYRGLINDNNGRFIPGNSDPGESWLEADYALVHFGIKSEQLNGRVYVVGRFNDWRINQENLMRYNQENKMYHATIRLKQGYYDYMYFVDSSKLPTYSLEGSHFQAENEYDILVYYRSPGKINDEVVGFFSMNSKNYF